MQLPVGTATEDLSLLGLRDAAHVPCMLVRSDYMLDPGMKVKFINGTTVVHKEKDFDGIVDPFIENPIPGNTLFWVFVHPDKVKSFTHNFDIEGIPNDKDSMAEEMNRLRERLVEYDDDDGGCRHCY